MTDNLRPMTEDELRQIVAQEAAQSARHDLTTRQVANGEIVNGDATESSVYHDAAHPAMTGTGTGDNRDETNDPEIAASLGGVGGAVVGAVAGALLGPAGAIAGAVVGGLTGMGVSGLAVDAVDRADDDTTLSGLPDRSRAVADDESSHTV